MAFTFASVFNYMNDQYPLQNGDAVLQELRNERYDMESSEVYIIIIQFNSNSWHEIMIQF